MADINIAALPAAGAFADADIFHISQSGADKKTTLSALDTRFSKVDIFGLTENTTPTTALFVPVAVDGTIANNRKVSLEKLGELVQAESFFTNDEDVDSTDEIPFRQDDSARLKQCTVGGLAKRILTFTDLANSLTAATVVDTDYSAVYDSSVTEPKKITIQEYRQSMLNTATLNALTDVTIDNADTLYVYDASTSEAKKITYSNIKAAITAALPFDDRISSTTADSAAGLIDFQGGIKTNTIVPSSGTSVALTGTLSATTEMSSALGNFTNVKGKVLGTNGNSGSLYIESVSSGSKFNIKGNELTPVDDNTTDLGTSLAKYKALYAYSVNTGALSATTSAALPYGTTVRNATNDANLVLMDSDTINRPNVINKDILPAATETTIGALKLATLAEVKAQSLASTTQAITAALLSQCIILNNDSGDPAAYTAEGDPIYIGHIELGGLLINYGWIGDGVNAMALTQTVVLEAAGLNGKDYTSDEYGVFTGVSSNVATGAVREVAGTRTTSGWTFALSGSAITYRLSFFTIGKA